MARRKEPTASENQDPGLSAEGEQAWVEVVRKMDETYEELVQQQVALEEKNSALEEAQRFIESVLGSMSDLLIVCDVAGRIKRVNPALEELVGRAATFLQDTEFHRLFAEPDQERLRTFPQVIRNDSVTDCEVRLVDAAGHWQPVAMNCTSRYDHRGRLVGMVLTARNVGELRRAYTELDQAHRELQETQHQLVQSEKMASLGRLIAGVAHELNNPISFLYGNVHVLRRYAGRLERYIRTLEEGADEEERLRLREELRIGELLEDLDPVLEGTLEGAQRVGDLVGELKGYSGGRRGSPETFNLSPVIRTASQWVQKGAGSIVSVDLDLAEELPVRGYSGQMHQVFVNLIQNAVDAVSEHRGSGGVTVVAARTGGEVRASIRDDGPGLEPDRIPELFEPFFTTKPPGQGTGLGLYIAYGIVSEHGGTLQAANRPEGGAELSLSLPLEGAV
ncbi:sensor histidine kinase [Thiohalorhabdus sp. Cl-TMA]|uniref:histidine kinase n=1 Tax=Thiohalorhabdus methylotrophus TaxID=3242694 RepID=A0ABV4TZS0_9GAMM